MATSTAGPRTHASADPTVPIVSRLESFRRYTYWSMVTATGVLLLVPAITGPVPRPPDPAGSVSWLALAVLLATLLPLIGELITPSPTHRARPSRWRHTMLSVSGLAAGVLAVTWLVAGAEMFWAFPPAFVASMAITPLPRARRRLAVVVTMLVAVGIGVALGIGAEAGLVPGIDEPVVVVTSVVYLAPFALFLTLATLWTWEIAVQLDDARKQAATLAVSNERLRFAADLHDIQGHHLQVIALKSELAERLMQRDPETARREIAAVRQLAADALSDTRAVVQGYRRASLGTEIGNAISVLGSAGIDARLHLDPGIDVDRLAEQPRHILGLVVREAVTNVLRHSTATRADIELVGDEELRLTITNDGVSGRPGPAHGGGLQDLAGRVEQAGGLLTWQREGATYRVQATLPAGVVVAAPVDAREGGT